MKAQTLPNKGMKLTNLAAAPELHRRYRGVRLAGMERTGSQLIPGVLRTKSGAKGRADRR